MQGDYDLEGPTYPSLFVWQQAIVRSPIWDYLGLFMFLIYLVVLIAVYDGLGADVVPEPGNSVAVPSEVSAGSLDEETAANAAAIGLSPATMLLPLIFMLLLQVAPAEETKEPTSPGNGKGAADNDAGSPSAQRKVNRKDKNYYLLTAKTEDYVDDSDLYKPRISRQGRLEYWEKMCEQKSRRKPPKSHMTYQNG